MNCSISSKMIFRQMLHSSVLTDKYETQREHFCRHEYDLSGTLTLSNGQDRIDRVVIRSFFRIEAVSLIMNRCGVSRASIWKSFVSLLNFDALSYAQSQGITLDWFLVFEQTSTMIVFNFTYTSRFDSKETTSFHSFHSQVSDKHNEYSEDCIPTNTMFD